MALAARRQGMRGLIVPTANAQEGAVVDGLEVIAVGSLAEAVGFYTEQLDIPPTTFQWDAARSTFGRYGLDYADVKGQESAKRAVTVAIAATPSGSATVTRSK